jgi:tRNA pseudouridine38-40 synthase
MNHPGAPLVRIDLGYDGTDFSGWAAQPGLRTVEGELSVALTTVLRAPDPVRLTVAGRTDAGVHARGQVAHADVEETAYLAVVGRSGRTPEEAATVRLRGLLASDIVVHRVSRAPAGFDARFAAVWRRYSYRIADSLASADPVRRRDTVWLLDQLDVDAMNRASAGLLGLKDFAAFCKRRAGATTVRTLLDFTWARAADGVVQARVVADAFCHSMVRSLVGSVVPVGLGRESVDWPARVAETAVRSGRVKVMPPHGLCLEEVAYPADSALSARALEARARRHVPLAADADAGTVTDR